MQAGPSAQWPSRDGHQWSLVSDRFSAENSPLRVRNITYTLAELMFFICERRHLAGGTPYSRLKARLKAVSV
jgi:hypothetical protein